MRPPISRETCGTYAGANAHKRHSETLCAPCRQAAADYVREWRRRTGRTRHTLQPLHRDGGPS